MEPLPMALLFVIPFLLLLGLISRLRRKPFPPGPKGLPIIGNMMMMDQLTHRGLAKLAHQYGGIFHLKMGFLHLVAISNPEMARQVLQSRYGFRSLRAVLEADEEAQRHEAFQWKRAESWESIRDEVDSLVKAVAANTGKAINMGELIFNLTKNIIYRSAFGSISQEGQDEFIRILQEFSKLFGAFNIADFIPWLGWADPQGLNTRLENARCALDKFIDTIIDDHIEKKKRNGDGPDDGDTDMVDDLLTFYSEEAKVNESEDVQNSIKLTRDNIKAIIMVNPRNAEEEEDAVVAGYQIPAKSRVMINAWAIGRDRNSWEDPDSFKPSRFLREGVPDFKGSNFEFIPFGSGRRSCPGMQLGLYALDMAVAHLLHCFTWELPDGMKPSELDMSDIFGLTAPRANRLYAVPKKRLVCPLF
ncbi:hypothetical protein GOBAR_AA05728 [Gossypium barbadense]|uniref:Uncharacterized protein n=1 Tax=Gossypium barbadense TaxID=3634 RepID=A0A2P5YH12_GOSBA|nr:hypothetical protein GOBAR_AA05728 [Gossypium barbadense]